MTLRRGGGTAGCAAAVEAGIWPGKGKSGIVPNDESVDGRELSGTVDSDSCC